jgi:hypothetical protein
MKPDSFLTKKSAFGALNPSWIYGLLRFVYNNNKSSFDINSCLSIYYLDGKGWKNEKMASPIGESIKTDVNMASPIGESIKTDVNMVSPIGESIKTDVNIASPIGQSIKTDENKLLPCGRGIKTKITPLLPVNRGIK